jgi:Transposase and inactivated derivatives
VVLIDPDGTTKQRANCGAETEKPLWVRDHSCPSCGFTADRDHNAALELHQRGLESLGVEFEQSDLGLGQSEQLSVEVGVTEGVRHRDALVSNIIIEAESPTRKHGSPTLKG